MASLNNPKFRSDFYNFYKYRNIRIINEKNNPDTADYPIFGYAGRITKDWLAYSGLFLIYLIYIITPIILYNISTMVFILYLLSCYILHKIIPQPAFLLQDLLLYKSLYNEDKYIMIENINTYIKDQKLVQSIIFTKRYLISFFLIHDKECPFHSIFYDYKYYNSNDKNDYKYNILSNLTFYDELHPDNMHNIIEFLQVRNEQYGHPSEIEPNVKDILLHILDKNLPINAKDLYHIEKLFPELSSKAQAHPHWKKPAGMLLETILNEAKA